MKRTLLASAALLGLMLGAADAQQAVQHIPSTGLVNNLVVKNAPGSLVSFNCTAVTGGAAGYCVAVNAVTAPSGGSSIAPLDFCYFDTTARGCSLAHLPGAANYTTGIVVLVTSAASPFTYTTGTDTAAVSADYQ